MIEAILAAGVALFARAVTGVRGNWIGCAPEPSRRVYFANHTSHGDFVLIWSVLPPGLRRTTRPVAAADYWRAGRIRRFCGERLFRAVLIDRTPANTEAHPVHVMAQALREGTSLILFPEGTRNTTAAPLLPFKAGLYHVARAEPTVECVPVWIDNLHRVMPKGEVLPVPLLCSVSFGEPLKPREGEGKQAFLARAQAALLALAPSHQRALA